MVRRREREVNHVGDVDEKRNDHEAASKLNDISWTCARRFRTVTAASRRGNEVSRHEVMCSSARVHVGVSSSASTPRRKRWRMVMSVMLHQNIVEQIRHIHSTSTT